MNLTVKRIKKDRFYQVVSAITFLVILISQVNAQSLTGVQMAGGMTADKYPVSVAPRTLVQNYEKNITFKIKNTTSSAISRAFKLYMKPTPSGTPVVLWQGIINFNAFEIKSLNRTTNPELGTIVTQLPGTYAMELRGSNTLNVNSVLPTSPLVPAVSGTNPLSIKVITDAVTLTMVTETIGIHAVKYPVSLAPLVLQRNYEKNISFSIRNLSNAAVTRAFKMYMIPLPSGPATEIWASIETFRANQTKSFSRTNFPNLGAVVTEAPGAYRLEIRGSNTPDLSTVTPSAPLLSRTANAQNPVTITIIECNPHNIAISPANPVEICPNGIVTLSVPLIANFTYQWRRNGINIPGATANTCMISTPGNYDVVCAEGYCPSFIVPAITATIAPPINATILGLNNSYTNYAPIVTMTGSPAGGTFSGPGVSGNTFNPYTAGVGTHVITYSGTYNGCPYLFTQTVDVTLSMCSEPRFWGEKKSITGYSFFTVIDFDNDGRNDLVTYNNNPGYLKLYRNNGSTFDAPITVNIPVDALYRFARNGENDRQNMYYTDFDNDGIKDLLINFTNGFGCVNSQVRIYWGLGVAPYFSASSYYNFALGGTCVYGNGIDYDGNGFKDVFIEAPSGTEKMYRNNGSRSFTEVPTITTGKDIMFSVYDWNRDEKEDLLGIDLGVFDGVWGVRYYASQGNGNFNTPLNYYASPSTEHTNAPHLKLQADPNQNPYLDFVFNMRNDGTNHKRLYTGTWGPSINGFTFSTQDVLPDGAYFENIIDYDRDGYDDIIVQTQVMGSNVLYAQHGDGNGGFARRTTIMSSPTFYFNGVFDFQNGCLKVLGSNADSLVIFNTNPYDTRYVKEDAVLNADLYANEFSVYPNPTDGAVTISLGASSQSTAHLQVSDALGKVIYQNTYPVSEGINKLDLDLSGFSAGIYIVNIDLNGSRKNCKLAVE